VCRGRSAVRISVRYIALVQPFLGARSRFTCCNGPTRHVAPQRKICLANMCGYTRLDARSRFSCHPVQRHLGKGHARPTSAFTRAAGGVVERGEGGCGKDDVNTARLTCRASGVACNALLGGPGAALKLRYSACVARHACLVPAASQTSPEQWNAVRERSKAARTRLDVPPTGRPECVKLFWTRF